MSNYLPKIEAEYSRGRGKSSRLSPMDWQLAQTWEDDGIPLRVVVPAMQEVFKNHAAQENRKREINSLRYFTQAVEQRFAEWKTSQVGKNTSEENTMKDECFAAYACADHTDVLEYIVEKLGKCNAPESLHATIAVTKGEILALLDGANQNRLSTDDIESRLAELRAGFELALILSVPKDDRAEIIRDIKIEYGKIRLMDEAEKKVLIRKLYQKFDLPELTLFAF